MTEHRNALTDRHLGTMQDFGSMVMAVDDSRRRVPSTARDFLEVSILRRQQTTPSIYYCDDVLLTMSRTP